MATHSCRMASGNTCVILTLLFFHASYRWTTTVVNAGHVDTLGPMRETSGEHDDFVRASLNTLAYNGKRVVEIAESLATELPTNISEACAHQSLYLLNHLNESWALQILDSIGKPAAGLLEGNVIWLGDYDECVNAITAADESVYIYGQYCLLTFPFQVSGYGGQRLNMQVGACVPSGCNTADTIALVTTVLRLLELKNFTNFKADCHQKDRPYDVGAIVTMVVCSIFAFFVTAGTLYDISRIIFKSYRNYRNFDFAQNTAEVSSQQIGDEYETKLVLENAPMSSSRALASVFRMLKKMDKVLLSFSVYSNGKKLLSTHQSEDTLGCVNGIRFLSMCWVILGHTYGYALPIIADPEEARTSVLNRRNFQVINNASVAVDSFFVLSGLLVSYLTLKYIDKRNGHLQPKEWGLMYLHRYIRLTGVYAVLLLIWTWLANHFYDGPLWPASGSFDPPCVSYWWTNLLYLNNFLPPGDELVGGCMGISWYLANDMQFFVITPPLVYLFYRKWRHGAAAMVLLIVASSTAALGISLAEDLTPRNTSDDGWNDYYIKPWCRFQTYGVGVLLGYILYKTKDKEPLRHSVVVAAWLIAAIMCLAVIYGPYDATYGSRSTTAPTFEYAANSSLGRLAWALGLSWVIFACCTKRGGWVNTLLSWKPFVPLARLTYCTYLVHPIVMTVAESASREVVNFDDITMTLRFLGTLVIALAFAFVSSVSVEAPILGVEKLLLQS